MLMGTWYSLLFGELRAGVDLFILANVILHPETPPMRVKFPSIYIFASQAIDACPSFPVRWMRQYCFARERVAWPFRRGKRRRHSRARDEACRECVCQANQWRRLLLSDASTAWLLIEYEAPRINHAPESWLKSSLTVRCRSFTVAQRGIFSPVVLIGTLSGNYRGVHKVASFLSFLSNRLFSFSSFESPRFLPDFQIASILTFLLNRLVSFTNYTLFFNLRIGKQITFQFNTTGTKPQNTSKINRNASFSHSRPPFKLFARIVFYKQKWWGLKPRSGATNKTVQEMAIALHRRSETCDPIRFNHECDSNEMDENE
jgi:hypothetical protein